MKYALVFLSIILFCPLIANEKPLLLFYQGHLYFPLIESIQDRAGQVSEEQDMMYSDPTIHRDIQKHGWAVWSPIPYSPHTLGESSLMKPSATHWLGTDDHGRDVCTRLLYGMRTSLWIGVCVTFSAALLGIIIGAIQGYYGGLVDLLGQRLLEIWSAVPILYTVMVVFSFLEPKTLHLLIIMMLFNWMFMAHLVRGEFLKIRTKDYVKAAITRGLPPRIIMFSHVLPNALVGVWGYVPFMLNTIIINLSALEFLGFGFEVGAPTLGDLMNQAKNNAEAWWLILSVCCALGSLIFLSIFISKRLKSVWRT